MSKKIDLNALPGGRFLFRPESSGTAPILEGRILERQGDPEKEGAWLKLADGDAWHWSADLWIEVDLEPAKTQALRDKEAADLAAASPKATTPKATKPK